MITKWVEGRADNSECDIYDVGTKVRIALEVPKDIEGRKQFGTFRTGDLRWSLKPYTIDNVIVNPRQPIRYKVKGRDRNTYSKGQLKVFNGSATPQVIGKLMERPKEIIPKDNYVVEKFVGSKTEKGKKYLKVKWEGYPSSANTWEKESELKKDMAD